MQEARRDEFPSESIGDLRHLSGKQIDAGRSEIWLTWGHHRSSFAWAAYDMEGLKQCNIYLAA